MTENTHHMIFRPHDGTLITTTEEGEYVIFRAQDGTLIATALLTEEDEHVVHAFAGGTFRRYFTTWDAAVDYALDLRDRYTAERIRYLEGLLHSVDTPCGEQDAIADAIAALKGGC